MKLIASTLAKHAGQVCVFVSSTADWNRFGELAWAEMVQTLQSRPPARRVMGVDTEWYKKNPLAVFQVATSSHCFVIHLSYLDQRALPPSVKQTLEDATVIKCGVGIHEDVKRLRREQNVDIQTIMNLENYAVLLGLAVIGQTNLGALTQQICGEEMVDKHKSVTMSNWELPLSDRQQRYAADDAVASYLVGDALLVKAVALRDTTDEAFDAAGWLSSTRQMALQRYKAAQKAKQRAAHDAQKAAAAAAAAGEAADGEGGMLRPFWSEGTKIRVLSKEGKFLFDCSTARAKFYVKEKGIAEITKFRPNSTHKAEEIRLLFDPQVKTRICLYDAVGLCELGKDCPYAHGVSELTEDAKLLLTSSEPSCAWCLSATNHLMKRAVVPPSFRKYLHPPLCYPASTDFVPLCLSCNSVVTRYIDEEMRRCYHEAEVVLKEKNESIPQMEIGKTISYARLLADTRKTTKIPEARLQQLKAYIWDHWMLTHMPEVEGRVAKNRKVVTHTSSPRAEDQDENTSPHKQDVDEDEGDQAADNEPEAEDDDAAHDEAEDEVLAEAPASSGKAPLTYPSSIDEVDGAFLERLGSLVPGDVRSYLTMEALMRSDSPAEQAEKEKAFVERWQRYLVDTCKMIEKSSNVLTNEQWEALKKMHKSESQPPNASDE